MFVQTCCIILARDATYCSVELATSTSTCIELHERYNANTLKYETNHPVIIAHCSTDGLKSIDTIQRDVDTLCVALSDKGQQ
jgi:hypothetical protein